MERYGVEASGEVAVVEDPGRDDPAAAASSRTEPLPETVEPPREREPLPERVEPAGERVLVPETVEPSSERKPASEAVEPPGERETLRAEVHRLEAELERYRSHAERTSKLFLSATNYAEWVRESARKDAELALRKASARVKQLEARARELERSEGELARVKRELDNLEALTEETRERLSAFLAAGLQALNAEGAAGDPDGHEPALGDLQDTLHGQLPSTTVSEPEQPVEIERPER